MSSRILGRVDLDQARLREDLATLRGFPRIEEAYDEFSSGYWKNCSLYNSSGEAGDTTYRDIDGAARQTDYGRRLPYLHSLVRESFVMGEVTMVRARNLIDAMVIPHRDFVELARDKQQYFRIFMVLEDNPVAFHSDEQAVFRMRPGEVWFLDAASIHAAANFSVTSRESLCVDFVFDGPFHERDIFADQTLYQPRIQPEIPQRPPLDPQFHKHLHALGAVINAQNFKDILFLLSKTHFTADAPITATYDWLLTVCQSSGDHDLITKAEGLRRYMIEKRTMNERFTLAV
jgi:hypothetical protein